MGRRAWLWRAALFLAFLIVAAVIVAAQEYRTTTFVHLQPVAYVRALCADPAIADEIERALRASLGCVTHLTDINDPRSVSCHVHLPTSMEVIARGYRERVLMAECETLLAAH